MPKKNNSEKTEKTDIVVTKLDLPILNPPNINPFDPSNARDQPKAGGDGMVFPVPRWFKKGNKRAS